MIEKYGSFLYQFRPDNVLFWIQKVVQNNPEVLPKTLKVFVSLDSVYNVKETQLFVLYCQDLIPKVSRDQH